MATSNRHIRLRKIPRDARLTPYPSLPLTPAFLSWELPPLPTDGLRITLRRWQAGHCAVCNVYRPDEGGPDCLELDHDHESGESRGYLCRRCNMAEARIEGVPFDLYRAQSPAATIGVLDKYGNRLRHPSVDAAVSAFWEALRFNAHEDGDFDYYSPRPDFDRTVADRLRAVGFSYDEAVRRRDELHNLREVQAERQRAQLAASHGASA